MSPDRLYSPNLRMGLVIGTYEALPQIHLQLEAWKRLCKGVPLLVLDDCSPTAGRMAELCGEYGAEFETNPERLNHTVGDMRTYVRGLEWARQKGVDLLVKFSRRWVPLVNWQQELLTLALRSQSHCFSNRCCTHRFGFRTECVAMAVTAWLDSDALAPIREEMGRGGSNLVEAVVHKGAGIAQVAVGHCCADYEQRIPPHPGCGSYVAWDFMGENRTDPRPHILWHEWSRAHEYHRALIQWGIDCYSPADFINPLANIRNV